MKITGEKNEVFMCENCSDIILRKHFYSAQDYLNCLDYIKSLIADGKFEMVKQTCDLDKVKNENGCWVDDSILHELKCKKCSARYTAHADTYHGGGGFVKEI